MEWKNVTPLEAGEYAFKESYEGHNGAIALRPCLMKLVTQNLDGALVVNHQGRLVSVSSLRGYWFKLPPVAGFPSDI